MDENMFYKAVDKRDVHGARLHQHYSLSEPNIDLSSTANDQAMSELPPYPFETGQDLLSLTKKHNVRGVEFLNLKRLILVDQITIAQIVYDNERYFGYTDNDIHDKVHSLGVCRLGNSD